MNHEKQSPSVQSASFLRRYFKLEEHHTTVKTEAIAGVTTFFAMAYIVLVAPNQIMGFTQGYPSIWNAVYIASILVAVIGTLLMAFYAKMPYAQACGMGLLPVFSVCFILPQVTGGGNVLAGYQAGIVIVFLSGILFLILSLTGIREYITRSIPDCIKKAIPAGIGLFIAYIGFQNVGLVQDNPYTLTQFADIHGALVGTTDFTALLPSLLAFFGVIIIAVLEKRQVKGSVMIGILSITVLYYLSIGEMPTFDLGHIGQAWNDFFSIGFLAVFDADIWRNAFSAEYVGGFLNGVIYVFVFCMVNMFDTVGTLYGAASQANMLDENGDPLNLGKAMTCDSLATLCSGILGTSTGSSYVESAAGIAAGGRTGLTSVVTAICFALCLFLTPLAVIVPACATAPALIYVGALMLRNIKEVDLGNLESAIPAFMTLIMMPLSYSIANGIGIGCISYILIQLFTGKFNKRDFVVAFIAALFVIKFVTVSL